MDHGCSWQLHIRRCSLAWVSAIMALAADLVQVKMKGVVWDPDFTCAEKSLEPVPV